jgi:hypothetical protein
MDLSINVRSEQVTVRSTEKDGKKDVKNDHLDLPPDVYNGMDPLNREKHPARDAGHEGVDDRGLLPPKPRLVKLAISPRGEEPFSLVVSQRKAMRDEIKIELGGCHGDGGTPDWEAAAGHSDLDHRRRSFSLRQGRRLPLSRRYHLNHPTRGSSRRDITRVRRIASSRFPSAFSTCCETSGRLIDQRMAHHPLLTHHPSASSSPIKSADTPQIGKRREQYRDE